MGGHTGATTTTDTGTALVRGCIGSTRGVGHAEGGGDTPAATGGGIAEVSTRQPAHQGRSTPIQTLLPSASLANLNFSFHRLQKISKEEEMQVQEMQEAPSLSLPRPVHSAWSQGSHLPKE